MPDILNTMQQSQVWVLGTPVYWQGPSAQFKLFLDRWCGQGQVVTFPEKRVILTIPLGAEEKSSRHLVGMLKGACEHLKMQVAATIVAPNVWDPGKVKEFPEILAEAYRAGKEVFA
jgi:multimeric flavodoxin WrbA